MSKAWESRASGHDWKGLLARGQDLDGGLHTAALAYNVDLSEGAPAKRRGSVRLDGATGVVPPAGGWTTTSGPYVRTSPGAFTVGVAVWCSTTGESRVVDAATTATTLVVTSAFSSAPAPNAKLVQHWDPTWLTPVGVAAVPWRDPVTGPYQEVLQVAMAAGVTHPRVTAFNGSTVTERLVCWPGAYVESVTSSSVYVLSSTMGLVAGHRIVFVLSSAWEYATILSVDHPARTITTTAPVIGTVTAGHWVAFHIGTVIVNPSAYPTEAQCVPFAGRVHIAFAFSGEGLQRTAPHPPLIYDGTRVYRHGLIAPTGTIGASVTGSGVLSGTFRYRAVCRSSTTGDESAGGTVSGTSPSSQQVRVGSLSIFGSYDIGLPAPIDPQVDQVRIYRTLDGGLTRYFLQQTVTYPRTTCTSGWTTTVGTIAAAGGWITGAAITAGSLEMRVLYLTGTQAGRCCIRPITSVVGTTVTLTTALPVAPTSGDLVWQIPRVTSNASWTAPAGGAYIADDNTPDTTLAMARPLREYVGSEASTVGGLVLDVPVPDSAEYFAVWPQASRLVAIIDGGRKLRFSDQPDTDEGFLKGASWPSINELLVNFDDGERIQAVVAFWDSLLIFKRTSTWRLRGAPQEGQVGVTLEPVAFGPGRQSLGTFGRRCVTVDENRVAFVSESGVHLLNRYTTDPGEGFENDRLSRAIDAYWPFLRPQLAQMQLHYVPDRRQLWLLFPPVTFTVDPPFSWKTTASSFNALCYQFDGGLDGTPQGWTVHGINSGTYTTGNAPIACACVAEYPLWPTGGPSRLMFVMSTAETYVLGEGTLDGGTTPFPCWYWSSWTRVAENDVSRIRRLDIQWADFGWDDNPWVPSSAAQRHPVAAAWTAALVGDTVGNRWVGSLSSYTNLVGSASANLTWYATAIRVLARGLLVQVRIEDPGALPTRFQLTDFVLWFQRLQPWTAGPPTVETFGGYP